MPFVLLKVSVMVTPSESVPVPSVSLGSKSLQSLLLVSCDRRHIGAPLFRPLDPGSLVLHVQLLIVVRLETSQVTVFL